MDERLFRETVIEIAPADVKILSMSMRKLGYIFFN